MAEIQGWVKAGDWLWKRKDKIIHFTVFNQTFSFENVRRLSLRTLEGILDEAGYAIVKQEQVEEAHRMIEAFRNQAYDTTQYILELQELRKEMTKHHAFLIKLTGIQEAALDNTRDVQISLENQIKRLGTLVGSVALWMKNQDHEALRTAAEKWRTGK